jgi:hypothetical protein
MTAPQLRYRYMFTLECGHKRFRSSDCDIGFIEWDLCEVEKCGGDGRYRAVVEMKEHTVYEYK